MVSALLVFMQMAIGTVMTVLATLGNDPSVTASLLLLGAAIVAGTCFAIASRDGPRAAP